MQLLIASGSGATANRNAFAKVNIPSGTTEVDLSAPIWWRDEETVYVRCKLKAFVQKHTEYDSWVESRFTCDPTKHRLAMTLPEAPLLAQRDALTSVNLAHNSLLELPQIF